MTRVKELDSPAASFWRTLAVVTLGCLLLVSTLPNALEAWTPPYGFGAGFDSGSNVINEIVPGSPSDRAGLHPGDAIDARQMSLYDLISIRGIREATPGQTVSVTVVRGNRRFPARLVAAPATPTFYSTTVAPLKRFVSLVFVFIAALLVFLRPARMTWAFYLYALGSADATAFVYSPFAPGLYMAINAVLFGLYAAAPASFVWFACRFPTDQPTGWRVRVDRWVPVAIVLMAAVGAIGWLTPIVVRIPYPTISTIVVGAKLALFALGITCLAAAYVEQRQQRLRLKWLIAGLVLSAVGTVIADILFALAPNPNYNLSYWHPDLLIALNIFVPIAVAYAVLRHRLLDVNFIVSRAVVYGILTSFLVTVFALIDWFFVRRLVATNLGLIAEIIAAIALGFWLNALHHRIDLFTDRVFFRRRYLAELRLARIATALPYASARAGVDDFLVCDPVDALDLASAAVFIRSHDGSYRREKSIGWPQGTVDMLDENDPMVLHLRSHFDALRVPEIRWPLEHLPGDAAYPALALPIRVRGQLVAMVFYGAHHNGADIDPDEVRIISGLAVGAGVAYDHLEVEAMRAELATARAQLASAQARIDALSAQLEGADLRPRTPAS